MFYNATDYEWWWLEVILMFAFPFKTTDEVGECSQEFWAYDDWPHCNLILKSCTETTSTNKVRKTGGKLHKLIVQK